MQAKNSRYSARYAELPPSTPQSKNTSTTNFSNKGVNMKNFYDRIREFRGKPVYEILAKTRESKGSFFVCYREYLDGKRTCRNLYLRSIGGYYCQGAPDKEMSPCILNHTPNIFQNSYYYANTENVKPLLKIRPDFQYIIKKMEINLYDVFKVFNHWSKYPKMELLLNIGLPKITMNKTFFKYKESKQKKILQYYKQNCHIEITTFVTLQEITEAMKLKRTVDEIHEYKHKCYHTKEITYNEWKMISPLQITEWDYIAYKKRLKEHFPERFNDEYWTKFNSTFDFHIRENKTIKEVKNMLEAEDRKKREEINKQYLAAIKRKLKWEGSFNGLHVYIPANIEDIKIQAEALEQCLIHCNYADKVIKKQSTLIFIRDGETPIATAELDNKSKKIIQFYGNEMDHDNCLPPENAKIALEMFTHKFIRKSA